MFMHVKYKKIDVQTIVYHLDIYGPRWCIMWDQMEESVTVSAWLVSDCRLEVKSKHVHLLLKGKEILWIWNTQHLFMMFNKIENCKNIKSWLILDLLLCLTQMFIITGDWKWEEFPACLPLLLSEPPRQESSRDGHPQQLYHLVRQKIIEGKYLHLITLILSAGTISSHFICCPWL